MSSNNNDTACSHCGSTSNSIDVYLCNQCISKINYSVNKSSNEIRAKDYFLEHIISDYDVKLEYPSDWIKIERSQINSPDTSIIAIFRPPETDSSLKELAVAIGLRHLSFNDTLKDFLESYIQNVYIYFTNLPRIIIVIKVIRIEF